MFIHINIYIYSAKIADDAALFKMLRYPKTQIHVKNVINLY